MSDTEGPAEGLTDDPADRADPSNTLFDPRSVLDDLVYFVELLHARTEDPGWDGDDIEALAPLLSAVAVTRKRLAEVENGLAEAVNKKMSKRVMTVAGVVLEQGGPSGSDKWDWDSLLPELVSRAADERRIDTETGEALESEVHAFVRVLTDIVSFQYARVGKVEEGTGLKGHGLDPDDFRTRPNGPRRAKVVLK